jgi:hypothetical protein
MGLCVVRGLFGGSAAAGPLRVTATVADLASLARVVGGDEVDVVALVHGTQDPHFTEPLPGIPPTTRHLGEVADLMQRRDVRAILSAAYFHRRYALKPRGADALPRDASDVRGCPRDRTRDRGAFVRLGPHVGRSARTADRCDDGRDARARVDGTLASQSD